MYRRAVATFGILALGASASPIGRHLAQRDYNGFVCPGWLGYAERIDPLVPEFPNYDIKDATEFLSDWKQTPPGQLHSSDGDGKAGSVRSYSFTGCDNTTVQLSEVLTELTLNKSGHGGVRELWNSSTAVTYQQHNVSNYYSSLEIYQNATNNQLYANYHINLCVVEDNGKEVAQKIAKEMIDAGFGYWHGALVD